ncbi:MAG: hypothetical protein LKF93_09720 [Bifidobacterium tibiigranuli]|jgi:hypothetical protein|nr:hypothetical protein [Bifidobacterium tibiigranuli]
MTAISMSQIIGKYKETHPEVREYTEILVGKGKNAKKFKIKHPVYRTNEENRRIKRSADAGGDDLVKAILGDDEYEAFIAAGGQDNAILMLLQLMSENDLPAMVAPDSEGKDQDD